MCIDNWTKTADVLSMNSIDSGNLRQLYPHIRFHEHWAKSQETCYQLGQCRVYVECIAGAPILPEYRARLLAVALRKGAQATTAIEGNTLSDAEVEKVERGEPLPPSQEYQEREVRNILDALNELLREAVLDQKVELISPELLLRMHRLIGHDLSENFAAVPGQFAQGSRVVGPYKAPKAEHVPALVGLLCNWLREDFHWPEQNFSTAIIQAIVSHIYVEWIHPFDDGNGRTGRLLEFYTLLRAGLPSIASHLLANHYNLTRPEYYRQLQRAHQTNDLTEFIAYAVTGLRDGLRATQALVRENAVKQMWQVLVYEIFRKRLVKQRAVFTRQRDVALCLPLDRPVTIPDVSKLTPEIAAQYDRIVSPRTVLRDLDVLESMTLITRQAGLVRANVALLENTLSQRRPSVVPALPATRALAPAEPTMSSDF